MTTSNVIEANQWITARQAAEMLNIHRATWRQWEATGRAPAGHRIGNKIKRWNLEELQAWIRAGCPKQLEWLAMRMAEAS